MRPDLTTFTDDQLRLFLRRVTTEPLLAYLTEISESDRERLLSLLSPTTRNLIVGPLADGVGHDADYAEIILERIVHASPCIFCKIIAGEAAGSFAYRDERVSAFMDLYPITRGHVLIAPNTHVEHMHAVEPEVASQLMHVAQRIAQAVCVSELGCDGYDLFAASGGAAGQDVFHVHLHVIPRYHGDGFGFTFPQEYPRKAERRVLDQLARQIAGCLD